MAFTKNYVTQQKTYSNREMYSLNYGTESLSHLGPKIWSLLPDDLKNKVFQSF